MTMQTMKCVRVLAAIVLLAGALPSMCLAADQVVFQESFDSLPLGPAVDETSADETAFTLVPPARWWIINDICTIGNPDAGVTEWEGWSFCDPSFWTAVAGDQNRSHFTKGAGVVAVADPDEWDDRGSPGDECTFWSWLNTARIPLINLDPRTVTLTFDSSWRPEDSQKCQVLVTFDTPDPKVRKVLPVPAAFTTNQVELLYWESDVVSDFFHTDEENETVQIPFASLGAIPAGAKYMYLTFGMLDSRNDWWWAIDNIVLTSPAVNPVDRLVSIEGGPLSVSEEGPTSAGLQIGLLQQPLANVVVTVDPNTVIADVTLSGATGAAGPDGTWLLTFTPANWNSPQTVTVTAVDDDLVEQRETGILMFGTHSTDPAYAKGYLATVVDVTIASNDIGAIFTETDGQTIVSEAGPASDSYTIVLSNQPVQPVIIQIADQKGQTAAAPGTIIFTAANWNQPQTVTVTAIDDAVLETDPHFSALTHTVSSTDPTYANSIIDDLKVTVFENECGAWGYVASDFNRDCIVNLEDLAYLSLDWLLCSEPNRDGCTRP